MAGLGTAEWSWDKGLMADCLAQTAGFSLRMAMAEDLPQLDGLWRALYRQQHETGMLLTVPQDGFDAWVASLSPMLGRFAMVVLAEYEGRIAGFLAGRVRALPAYFGGQPAGFVSDVYVDPDFRRRGIAEAMVHAGIQWFEESGITRIELQVVVANEDARRLYRRLGWKEELLQMVWQNEETDL